MNPNPVPNPILEPISYTLPDLLGIMAKLRAPDGCPWDKKQTHQSLLNYLIEESYEYIEAVENGDKPNMKEELGDVLLQVVFHAQLAKETGDFDFAQVVNGISDKLVRRHPHVFGDLKLDTAESVEKKWDELKKAEKAGKAGKAGNPAADGAGMEMAPGEAPEGGLGRMPRHLPALLKADKLQKRAAQHGFDWPDYQGPLDKVREELDEFREEARAPEGKVDPDRLESEFGDLLFAAVNLGRFFKLDPEKALARANRKFMDRYEKMEKLAQSEGKDFAGLGLEEKESFWIRVKGEEVLRG
ncbi:MAG: nucleoside triphosphate pyrophosphohydrolase [Fibrobacterota bacterium]|nr:nucleoside triphosphate pyrophosphohydrolase [Fibrobacterota bacterium]